MSTFLSRLWVSEVPEKLPAFDADSVKTLAAKALHSVLRGTLLCGVLYAAVIIPLFVARKAASSAQWAVMAAVILACIFLLRRGYVRLRSWIFSSTACLTL